MKAKKHMIYLLVIAALMAAGPASADDTYNAPTAVRTYKVPQAVRTAVQARKTELASIRLGIGPFLHLYQAPRQWNGQTVSVYLGSGYDYYADVVRGLALSGLFGKGQLGPVNDPEDESWDYLISCEYMGFSGNGDVKFALAKKGKRILEEGLPLPAEWNKAQTASQMVSQPAGRTRIMAELGEYLAYKAAARILGVEFK